MGWPDKKKKRILIRWFLFIWFLYIAGTVNNALAETDESEKPVYLKVEWYSPVAYTVEEQAQNRAFEVYMQNHPEVKILPFSTLRVIGAGAKSGKLMSVAADMAPDIWRMWFHEVLKYSNQGFLQPLNKYIGEDADGDGLISGDEVIYKPWSNILDQYKAGCVKDGNIYALPYEAGYMQAVCYRRDLFTKAGLDPDKPPLTWEELYYYAQKLTFKADELPGQKKEQRGLHFSPYGYTTFNPLVWAAGGDLVRQFKQCSQCDHTTESTKEEHIDSCTKCGGSLQNIPVKWKAAFDSPAGLKAVEYLHKLRWQRWSRCSKCKEPFDLSHEMLQVSKAVCTHCNYAFPLEQGLKSNIYTGVLHIQTTQDEMDIWESFAKGHVGMFFMYSSEMGKVIWKYGVPPEQLGLGPPPGIKGGKIIANAQPIMFGISRSKIRSQRAEKIAWDILSGFTSENNLRERVKILVEGGRGRLVHPPFLELAGYKELYESLPQSWREVDERIDYKRTEPYNAGWTEVQMEITPAIVQRIFEEENIDLKQLLKDSARRADRKFERWPEEKLARYRPMAWTLIAIGMLLFCLAMWHVMKSLSGKVKGGTVEKATTSGQEFKMINYIWILPAFLSILVWKYYPLIRGSVMAFQDYKIAGESSWVGVDNFIMIFGNPMFYKVMINTGYYVGLTILIGFVAPIFLGVLLTEVPKGKYIFRTIFYLPTVTSGLVIMFLWKRFYDPSPTGFLNTLIISLCSFFHVEFGGFRWLQDPNLAMLCIIIPGVWAGAGAGSLIYQAALRSVPSELYEAADVDGAGILSKFFNITVPTLKPLIIINFVGVFIGAFHAMQNIFVMTGGGPYNATRVIGIDIWFNAFMYLRFGIATAMAWVLGVMLIGFTVMQLRILSKVEFKKAAEN